MAETGTLLVSLPVAAILELQGVEYLGTLGGRQLTVELFLTTPYMTVLYSTLLYILAILQEAGCGIVQALLVIRKTGLVVRLEHE